MGYKEVLFWKTFLIISIIEFVCFLISFTLGYFLNDFIGRSLFALCLIFIPIIVSYSTFYNKVRENFIFRYNKDIDKLREESKKQIKKGSKKVSKKGKE